MQVHCLTTPKQMLAAFEVMSHMYPDLSQDEFLELLAGMVHKGYSMIGVIDEQGKCIGAAGYWIGVRLYCRKFIQIDNLVVLPEKRGKQAGKMMMDEIKQIGREEGCQRVILDTYVENFDAHRFFYREGFIIRGYHMNFIL